MTSITNHNFKKRFGQNFIFDQNLLMAIASDAGITNDDFVIEVGAGAGTLTEILAAKAKRVTAFEIDTDLKVYLDGTKQRNGNLTIIYGDILKQDLREFVGDEPYKVVANLPYYITSPIIFYFLDRVLDGSKLQSLTIMVQKEVADRLVAKPGTKDYGAITVQVNALGTVKVTRQIGRQVFTPPPNVDSAVVKIDINPSKTVKNFTTLKKVIKVAFSMRRKTLLNNLSSGFGLNKESAADILNKCGIDLNARGETLDISKFIELANIFDNTF